MAGGGVAVRGGGGPRAGPGGLPWGGGGGAAWGGGAEPGFLRLDTRKDMVEARALDGRLRLHGVFPPLEGKTVTRTTGSPKTLVLTRPGHDGWAQGRTVTSHCGTGRTDWAPDPDSPTAETETAPMGGPGPGVAWRTAVPEAGLVLRSLGSGPGVAACAWLRGAPPPRGPCCGAFRRAAPRLAGAGRDRAPPPGSRATVVATPPRLKLPGRASRILPSRWI
jgi:hypothetical protein